MFRNSTGGGLQSVGNISPAACILGFLDHLGAEVGLRRYRVRWGSPWCTGWFKQLPFRLGKRMVMSAAAWAPGDGKE